MSVSNILVVFVIPFKTLVVLCKLFIVPLNVVPWKLKC